MLINYQTGNKGLEIYIFKSRYVKYAVYTNHVIVTWMLTRNFTELITHAEAESFNRAWTIWGPVVCWIEYLHLFHAEMYYFEKIKKAMDTVFALLPILWWYS
jgi:hypothetical protein